MEQRVDELEVEASGARLHLHEKLADQRRRHKAETKRMATDRAAYEERANAMVVQMNDQMQTLQSAAMVRIETLEKESMMERGLREDLEAQVATMKLQQKQQQLLLLQSSSRSTQKLGRGGSDGGGGGGGIPELGDGDDGVVSPGGFLHLEVGRGGRRVRRLSGMSSVSSLDFEEDGEEEGEKEEDEEVDVLGDGDEEDVGGADSGSPGNEDGGSDSDTLPGVAGFKYCRDDDDDGGDDDNDDVDEDVADIGEGAREYSLGLEEAVQSINGP
jgi:hypothetical protein